MGKMKTARASEGKKAYTAGLTIDDCPYSPDEDWQAYIQWREGFKNAERDARSKRQ